MKNIDFNNLTDDQLDRLVNDFKTINNSIMEELFKVGQRIKMQPFIDSDKWVYGTIKEIDTDSIVVDWEDKPNEIFRHYKYEYKDFKIY